MANEREIIKAGRELFVAISSEYPIFSGQKVFATNYGELSQKADELNNLAIEAECSARTKYDELICYLADYEPAERVSIHEITASSSQGFVQLKSLVPQTEQVLKLSAEVKEAHDYEMHLVNIYLPLMAARAILVKDIIKGADSDYYLPDYENYNGTYSKHMNETMICSDVSHLDFLVNFKAYLARAKDSLNSDMVKQQLPDQADYLRVIERFEAIVINSDILPCAKKLQAELEKSAPQKAAAISL